MRTDNIWVTTQVINETYNRVPKDLFVTWEPGMQAKGILTRTGSIRMYKDSTLFRRPTPTELENLLSTLSTTPLRDKVYIKGNAYVGSDPEVFVVDEKGKIIPSYLFLQDKKKSKEVYWDGFQSEFTTTPTHCIAYFVDEFRENLQTILCLAKKVDPTARLTGKSVLKIPKKYLSSATPEQVALGCMPSLNAYSMNGEVVEDGKYLPVRFAGMHVHLASTGLTQQIADPIVKFLDSTVGVISVSVLAGLEDSIRRQFYGLAGEYRLPKHGLEYRVLSSACLWHPMLVHFFFNLTRSFFEIGKRGFTDVWKSTEAEVLHTVNTYDVSVAHEIIRRNEGVLKEVLEGLYRGDLNFYTDTPGFKYPEEERIISEFILGGVKKYMDLDMEKNWYISRNGWKIHSEGPEVNFARTISSWLNPPASKKEK